MNVSDFNSKNRAEMVDRIVKKRILTESSWNIENFDTAEKIEEELKRLQNEKEKHLKDDDMPSMYYENIDKHIEELNAKMDTSECDCKKVLKEEIEYLEEWSLFKSKKEKNINNNNRKINQEYELFKSKYDDLIKSVPDADMNKKTRRISHSELRIIRDEYLSYMLSDRNVDSFRKLYLNTTVVDHGKWVLIKNTNQILDKEYRELIDSDDERFQEYIKYLREALLNLVKEDEEENEMTYNRNYFKKRDLEESRLPSDPSVDPQFGVPSQKKYPLFDEQHVRSAIKLFGHVDPAYERELARAIIAKMRKYNIPYNSVGPDNRLYKYIPEKFRKEE